MSKGDADDRGPLPKAERIDWGDREQIVEIVCFGDNPRHGRQVMARLARDLTGRTTGLYLKSGHGTLPGDWTKATTGQSQLDARCPAPGCPTRVLEASTKVRKILDVLFRDPAEPGLLTYDWRRKQLVP